MRTNEARFFLLIVLFLFCLTATLPVWAQSGRRVELAQSIARQYGLTEIGPSLLGMKGGRGSIRHAGGVVLLAKEGLQGSLDPDLPTSYAIRNGTADLFRGEKDQALAAGEALYIHSVYAGRDVIVLGLLTARIVNTAKGSGRLWLSLSFFFPEETLATGNNNSIFLALDTWLTREDQDYRTFASRQTYAGRSAGMAPPAEPAQPSALETGMSREEIVEVLGPPQREVSFGERAWLTYPGMVILFEKGQLASVEDPNQARAQVAVSSDPDGARIYLDDSFVGSTPATLSLKAATYKITLLQPGYEPWEEKVQALAGSKLNVSARLKKLPATSSE